MQKKQFVAVDTNVALLLAAHDDLTTDAVELLGRRIQSFQVLAPRTVIGELTFQANNAPDLKLRNDARSALSNFQKYKILSGKLDSVQEAIAGKAAQDLRCSGLISFDELNDALIVAESAVLNCVLLVSNDSHLLEIDAKQLGLFFRERDLPAPIIVSPRDLMEKFYR